MQHDQIFIFFPFFPVGDEIHKLYLRTRLQIADMWLWLAI